MNSSTVAYDSSGGGLISHEDFPIIRSAIMALTAAMSLTGAITNILNIWTFLLMGVSDGISVSFFALAVSDFLFTSFVFVYAASYVIDVAEVTWGLVDAFPVQPWGVVGNFFGYVGYAWGSVTCLNITFLAVARALCVAMPFRFRDYFTKTRCLIAQVTFPLVAFAFYSPILSQMGTQRAWDRAVNRTRVVLRLTPRFSDYNSVTLFVNAAMFVLPPAVISIVCACVMAKHLRQSVRFRKSATTTTVVTGNNTNTNTTGGGGGGPNKDRNQTSNDNNSNSKSNSKKSEVKVNNKGEDVKLSAKELQIVRQVLVICVIFLTCAMVPSLIITLCMVLLSTYGYGSQYHYLYLVLNSLHALVCQTNSIATFPTYYTYNSRFRAVCSSSICRRRPRPNDTRTHTHNRTADKT